MASQEGLIARWYCDLDLEVVTEAPLPMLNLRALKEVLSESDLPWKVGVPDWSTASPALRERIWAQCTVLQPGEGDQNR